MSGFNTKETFRPRMGASALKAAPVATGTTWEGGNGFLRDPRTQLFLSATTRFAGEDNFYESGQAADDRVNELARGLAADEAGWAWLQGFLPWLRSGAYIRTASIMLAAEAAHWRWKAGRPGGIRQLVASVLQRADEPGEFMAYWFAHFGRKMPTSVKRGIADALVRLYTEYGWLNYDNEGRAFRFADVIELACPRYHKGLWGSRQDVLWRHIIEQRHSRGTGIPDELTTLLARQAVLETVRGGDYSPLTSASTLHAAGMTWKTTLSVAGSHVSKEEVWMAQLPSTGYMALLRNLRNLDEAGISDLVAGQLCRRIADPAEVARSKQLPYRFLSAYLEAPSLRWGHALEQALDHSTAAVPALPGRTVALIDISGSMAATLSEKSKVSRAMAGALFAAVLAKRNGPGSLDLWIYGTSWEKVEFQPARSALAITTLVQERNRYGTVGHGTNTGPALQAAYSKHDRVFIFTDGQSFPAGYGPGVDVASYAGVPQHVPVYAFDLSGYEHSGLSGLPNRHELGGLTDHTFRFVTMIEAGREATWPWEAVGA